MASSQAPRLVYLFTPAYAARINAQIVHPAQSQIVKPHELESALMRPLQTSTYEPYRSPSYLAATLSYGLMKGHPFMDGNKRTAFFLANEYLRAHGLPGLAGDGKVGRIYAGIIDMADRHIRVAAGELELDGLAYEPKK